MRTKIALLWAVLLVAGAAVAPSTAREKSGDQVLDAAKAFQEAFVRVAEKARPAVVTIDTEQIVDVRVWDPFDLFRSPFEAPAPRVRRYRREGLGSGFLFRPDGYILTNNHVIKDVDSIRVHFEGKDKVYPAEVVGVDPATDLAVIKIKGDDFPFITLGDSDKIRVGEWAIAIGAPFGQTCTVSVGVISATGRKGFNLVDYEDFIQTDTAINPGNSGGPLLNIEGEAIGVNTFIIRPDAAQNMGFAIPINMFKKNEAQLVKKGKVSRGWLGVTIAPVTDEVAKYYGLESTEGALVEGFVEGDSPAKDAGLEEGDVIVGVDGKKITDVSDLQARIAARAPGSTVEIDVIREGEPMSFQVKLGERPAKGSVMSLRRPKAAEEMGIRVGEITPDIQRQLQLPDRKGVVIMDVEAGSSADRVGLRRGDVIVGVDKMEVNNLDDFAKALDQVGDRPVVRLRVVRGGVERFYFVERKKSKE